ncbi:hypothetical protein Q7P37_008783 [Cladosporium fusiforme]
MGALQHGASARRADGAGADTTRAPPSSSRPSPYRHDDADTMPASICRARMPPAHVPSVFGVGSCVFSGTMRGGRPSERLLHPPAPQGAPCHTYTIYACAAVTVNWIPPMQPQRQHVSTFCAPCHLPAQQPGNSKPTITSHDLSTLHRIIPSAQLHRRIWLSVELLVSTVDLPAAADLIIAKDPLFSSHQPTATGDFNPNKRASWLGRLLPPSPPGPSTIYEYYCNSTHWTLKAKIRSKRTSGVLKTCDFQAVFVPSLFAVPALNGST